MKKARENAPVMSEIKNARVLKKVLSCIIPRVDDAAPFSSYEFEEDAAT